MLRHLNWPPCCIFVIPCTTASLPSLVKGDVIGRAATARAAASLTHSLARSSAAIDRWDPRDTACASLRVERGERIKGVREGEGQLWKEEMKAGRSVVSVCDSLAGSRPPRGSLRVFASHAVACHGIGSANSTSGCLSQQGSAAH